MSPKSGLARSLQRVMMVRMVFAGLLFAAALAFQVSQGLSFVETPLVQVYGLIVAIFGLNLAYALWLPITAHESRIAIVQAAGDTLVVTAIIAITGGFSSVFTFLYLIVIIYASMLLPRASAAVVAGVCAVQFALVTLLENLSFFNPLYLGSTPQSAGYPASHLVYHVAVISFACMAVAALSMILVEQNRRSTHDLRMLEDHVKRVERMASLGEMAAGMAHEIKNPLASLAGSIQLLREDIPFNSFHDRLMRIVLRETDRLSVLVNNFLMFAKPPAGRVSTVDLGRAVSEILEVFEQDDTRRERIAVVADLEPDVSIAIDPSHLHQIIWNLLVNAAEAIDGSGRIQLRLNINRSREAVLTISDSGSGIPDDTMGSIFNPFFTTKSNGTGLGLSVVYSLLEAYKARIGVESQEGEGTTFTLVFQYVGSDSLLLSDTVH